MCSSRWRVFVFQDECYNYVKVLVPRNDETLFACGTNAFNPTCRNYKVNIYLVWTRPAGVSRCVCITIMLVLIVLFAKNQFTDWFDG